MTRDEKKGEKGLGKKVVESFEDFADLSFKDIVSFPDGREEVIIQNYQRKGKCITCRKLYEGNNKDIRKTFYFRGEDLNSAEYRDFDFNNGSSDFEKGQYAFMDLVLDSSYRNI